MESKKTKAAASAAAALTLAAGGAVKFSDDVGRLVGTASHDVHVPPPRPHLPTPEPLPLPPPPPRAQPIESQIDSFAASTADSEAAREAGLSAGCDVLYIAWTEERLPDGDEWVGIAIGAVDSAALDVPVGSPAWFELEDVKDQIAGVLTDDSGFVDDQEAESVAEELACAWA